MNRWIKNSSGDIVCEKCGEELPYIMTSKPCMINPYGVKEYIEKTPYCPYCGEKMNDGAVAYVTDGVVYIMDENHNILDSFPMVPPTDDIIYGKELPHDRK